MRFVRNTWAKLRLRLANIKRSWDLSRYWKRRYYAVVWHIDRLETWMGALEDQMDDVEMVLRSHQADIAELDALYDQLESELVANSHSIVALRDELDDHMVELSTNGQPEQRANEASLALMEAMGE